MGWDITFHPVSERELQRFLFDVLDTPSLLEARLAELCPDPVTRQKMRAMFEVTLRVVEDERLGIDRDDEEDDDEEEDRPFSAGHGTRWLGAAVAGCLHPYWYSRNAALQRVPELFSLVRPLAEIGTGCIREIDDYMGPHITGNFGASGFITPAGVRDIAARIKAKDPALVKQFGDPGEPEWESLSLAIDYAKRRNLGLIEANDLMVAGVVFASEPRNLRAHFLKNVTADKRSFRGPSPAWLVLLGIMMIVIMFTPGTSTLDTFVGLILFAFLLKGMLAGLVAVRLLSRRADK
jgi:hypothetical protein